MVTIYLANLGAYNRGYLVGKHITLPVDEDKLKDAINEVLNGEEAVKSRDFHDMVDEEYAVHDYETDLNIEVREYGNIWKLNEALQEVESLSEEDIDKVKAILDAGLEDNLMSIINELDEYYVYENIHSDTDIGNYYLDDEDIPEYVKKYIDYESYGEDSRINELGEFTDYGYVKRLY